MSRRPPGSNSRDDPSSSNAIHLGSAEPMMRGPLGGALLALDVRLRRLPPLVALALVLGPFTFLAAAIMALGAHAILTR